MGITSGIITPIRGVASSKGSLCVVFDANTPSDELALLPNCEVWTMYLHNHVESLYVSVQLQTPLSRCETEVLEWTVSGKTCSEIAQILIISQNTVLFHLTNLRYKLDVNNKHHLIARALSLGLVEL